jgi:hypothetical protein
VSHELLSTAAGLCEKSAMPAVGTSLINSTPFIYLLIETAFFYFSVLMHVFYISCIWFLEWILSFRVLVFLISSYLQGLSLLACSFLKHEASLRIMSNFFTWADYQPVANPLSWRTKICIETPQVRSTKNQRKQTNTPWGICTRKQLKALLPQRSVWSNWESLGCKGARQIK